MTAAAARGEVAHEVLRAAFTGDERARQSVIGAVFEQAKTIARSHADMRRWGFASDADDVAEVAMGTLRRITADDWRNLGQYLAQLDEQREGSAQTWRSWVRGATTFEIGDFKRSKGVRKPSAERENERGQPTRIRLTQAASLDAEKRELSNSRVMGLTTRLTLDEIFEHVGEEFTPHERQALELYFLQALDFAQLASALGLSDAGTAAALIRALKARLRERFRE